MGDVMIMQKKDSGNQADKKKLEEIRFTFEEDRKIYPPTEIALENEEKEQ